MRVASVHQRHANACMLRDHYKRYCARHPSTPIVPPGNAEAACCGPTEAYMCTQEKHSMALSLLACLGH